ncbi:hypothetical protein M1349_05730 [Patescibacteria group bacterium]|nr:hypothetical protein [Patescibacteria group bacterium]
MYKKITKLIIILLISTRIFVPVMAYAQVAEPTDIPVESISSTPAPTDTPTPTPDLTQSLSTEQSVTPTPTPDVPTPTPDASTLTSDQTTVLSEIQSTPTPTPTPSIDNSASVTNNQDTTAITGENEINSTPPTSETNNSSSNTAPLSTEQTSTATISAGDSISVSTGENNINSTSVNSKIVYQTINIFADQSGNIDLSTPANVVNSIINNDKRTDPVINVTIINNESYAYLANDIVSFADTGNNSISGAENAYINTGNAYSAVSLLNKLNLTVINSELHLITINVFGKLSGNIVLPDQVVSQPTCSNCSYQEVAIGNTANVENNVTSTAITGQNKIEGTGLTAIDTGEALAVSNVLNLVNANYIGVNITNLKITNFGNWQGTFLGWGDLLAQVTSNGIEINSLSPNTGCVACGNGTVNITNYAEILNNIISSANTGGNSMVANNGSIKTGNAISQVSLFNLINSNIINSNAYFTFINIFGEWIGSIGDKKSFMPKDSTKPKDDSIAEVLPAVESKQNEETSSKRENGGLLEVSITNNVGEYVLPGDTVTFFIKVKNPGKGKVYDGVLQLMLLRNEKNVGTINIDLPEIEAGKTVKISTGMVLSKRTPGGEYIGQAQVTGVTGEENTLLSASADSYFKVYSTEILSGASTYNNQQKAEKKKEVLGVKARDNISKQDQSLLLGLLFVILSTNFGINIIRKRDLMAHVFAKNISIKSRIHLLSTILL